MTKAKVKRMDHPLNATNGSAYSYVYTLPDSISRLFKENVSINFEVKFSAIEQIDLKTDKTTHVLVISVAQSVVDYSMRDGKEEEPIHFMTKSLKYDESKPLNVTLYEMRKKVPVLIRAEFIKRLDYDGRSMRKLKAMLHTEE